MSPTIFAIAAIPAAAVYFVGLLSKSHFKTLVAAIAMGLLGAATGSPAYTFTDLFFVAVAYLWTSGNFTQTAAKDGSTVPAPARREALRAVKDAGTKVKEVIVALAMAAIAITVAFLVLAYALIWYNSTQKMPNATAPSHAAPSASQLQ